MLFDDTVYVMEIIWQFHLEILLQWMKCFVTWLEETDVYLHQYIDGNVKCYQ